MTPQIKPIAQKTALKKPRRQSMPPSCVWGAVGLAAVVPTGTSCTTDEDAPEDEEPAADF